MSKPLDRLVHPELYARAGELAHALGLADVELYVSSKRGSNAWVPAAGSRRRRITLTWRKLEDPDLDWTLAHELAHLAAPPAVVRRLKWRHRLFVLLHLTLAATLWLKLKTSLPDRPSLLSQSSLLGLILVFALLELAALCWLLAAMRQEEYRADVVATRLAGSRRTADFFRHPRYVDGRLRRLGAYAEYWLQAQVEARTPLGRLLYLFQSHPTISERARALGRLETS